MSSPTTSPDARTREELRALLGLPRPRVRGDCLQEARPCPWASCRHHLLLEVARGTKRQGLSLSVPRTIGGRRPHLASSCDDVELGLWTDEAVSTLVAMPSACALDAADQGEHTLAEIAGALRLSEAQVGTHHNDGLRRLYVGVMRSVGEHVDEHRLPGIKHLVAWLRGILDA